MKDRSKTKILLLLACVACVVIIFVLSFERGDKENSADPNLCIGIKSVGEDLSSQLGRIVIVRGVLVKSWEWLLVDSENTRNGLRLETSGMHKDISTHLTEATVEVFGRFGANLRSAQPEEGRTIIGELECYGFRILDMPRINLNDVMESKGKEIRKGVSIVGYYGRCGRDPAVFLTRAEAMKGDSSLRTFLLSGHPVYGMGGIEYETLKVGQEVVCLGVWGGYGEIEEGKEIQIISPVYSIRLNGG